MQQREHHYETTLRWRGNLGSGTSSYTSYDRAHDIDAGGRPRIVCSSDPHFRGNAARWNPELLLLASLSSCHQLWYLHLCSEAGVVVIDYEDHADGWMTEHKDGSGEFLRAVLHPSVSISAASNADTALALHAKAHAMCFIARSVKFPVECAAAINVAS